MASNKSGANASGQTVKLDGELRRWVDALKAHYGTTDDAEAIRRVILTAHPDIREVAK